MNEPLTLYTFKNMNKGSGVLNLVHVRNKLMKDYIDYLEPGMKCKIFSYKQKKQYIFTFKIPSESNYKYVVPFYYDVAFCFTPMNQGQSIAAPTLNDYYLTIYSNMHSFIFNYCYVFRDNLIPWVPRKYYTPLALKMAPEKRNFYQIKSYEKSLYTAYLHLLLNRYYVKDIMIPKAVPILGYGVPLKELRTQDDILLDKKKFDKEYRIKDQKKLQISKERFDKLATSVTREKTEKLNFLNQTA